MRRFIPVVAILAVVCSSIVMPAASAASFREEDTFTTFGCDDSISSGRSSLYLYEAGTSTAVGGPFIDAELSSGRTYLYTLYQAGSGTVVDNLDGTISVDVANAVVNGRTGAAAGTLEVHATLATVGDPYSVNDREHDPGYGFSVRGTVQDLTLVSGTATYGSTTFVLPDSCYGRRGTLTFLETYPGDSRSSYRYLSCALEGDRGVTAYLDAYADAYGGYVDLFIELSRRSYVYGSTETFEFTDDALDASVSLDGDATGTATVAATLAPTGETETTTFFFAGGYDKTTRQLQSVAGSLDVSLDTGQNLSFDLSQCDAAEAVTRFHYYSGSGPKPGPAPANDLPANAIRIAPGASIEVDTSGAAAVAEETSCEPLGKSVWYTVAGTGATMTFDTTGTLFDTMVAVYTSTKKGFKLVTCVDDVDSSTPYQAIASFATNQRTTYWIQVGGFGAQGGDLKASLT